MNFINLILITIMSFTDINISNNQLDFKQELITYETTFEKKVKEISSKHDLDYKDILAIAEVETKTQNLIGDKHLANKAYGYFQIRQVAVDEVNRIYGFQGIKNASELLNNEEKQIEYACYLLKHLKKNTTTERQYITAYNMGLGSVKRGKTNNYYNKFLKARGEILL